ncbi:hypothetical protein C8A05DRAFT_14223, partial [Staphylotrichum tortipilum]
DDLGNTRQDNLPLDDKPKHHDHGHNVRHGGRWAYNNHGFPAPPPAQRAQPAHNIASMGWSLDDVWKGIANIVPDAISAGAFDDEDAHGVKGLDDLGGGRLYDNTGASLSQRDRVTGKTMRILEQRDKRSAFQFSQQPMANKKVRANGPSGGHRSATMSVASQQQNRAASMRSASRDTSMSSGSRHTQTNVNPMARPVRPPRPPTARPLDLPMTTAEIDPNTPLPFEIPNILFKINVRFLSRDINPALPALVVLSAAKPPQLGFFTTVLFSRKFCEWPISAWYDYSTGADNQLGMSFQDGHSSFQSYQLYFNEEKELVQFMDVMRVLKDGKPADEAASKTPAPVPRPPTPASKAPAPVLTTTTGVPAALAPVATKTSVHVAAPTKGESVGPPTPQTMVAGFGPHPATLPVAKVMNGPVQAELQDEKMAESVHGTLIDLENDDKSVADSQPPSEATDLLLTLDTHDFSKEADSHISPADHVPRKEIVDTARNLFNFFLLTGTGGKAETMAQLNEMAEGVCSGVLEHMIQDARARGFSTDHLEEIREMVNGVFAALVAAKKKTLPDGTAFRPSRLQYTAFELMSMRHGAVQPPGCFFEVPYLPKPGDRPRQVSGSSRGRAFSQPSPKPRTTFDQSQAAKSANAMQWVLGAVESKPAPQAPGKESKKVGADTMATARPGDSGLQRSRWASGSVDIKHANYFTGPAYERTWSKRSYLEDLAQLDPNAKITAGAEDLMNLYFPMPQDEEKEPGPTTARRPTRDGQVPPPNPSRSGPDTPVREMENLRMRMARLTLLSPTPRFVLTTSAALMPSRARQAHSNSFIVPPPPGPEKPAVPPPAQPTMRGLGASRHSSGTVLTSAGKFDHHVAGSGRK